MSAQPLGTPTYYVRHPDGSFSIARPQPTAEQIAAQADFVYAQCDRQHTGLFCCNDPNCYQRSRVVRGLSSETSGSDSEDAATESTGSSVGPSDRAAIQEKP